MYETSFLSWAIFRRELFEVNPCQLWSEIKLKFCLFEALVFPQIFQRNLYFLFDFYLLLYLQKSNTLNWHLRKKHLQHTPDILINSFLQNPFPVNFLMDYMCKHWIVNELKILCYVERWYCINSFYFLIYLKAIEKRTWT